MTRDIKSAIITGATGMLGATLAGLLSSQGVQVYALVRKDSKKIANIEHIPGVELLDVDLFHIGEATLPKADAWFHFAWAGTYGDSRNQEELQEKNLQAALEAVRKAAQCGVKVFLGAGSQAEYGPVSGKLTANTPTHPVTMYGRYKLKAGQETRALCKTLGMDHIWTRILSVYGPMDNDYTMVMSGISKLLDGQRPVYTKGEQIWDYLYSQDAAHAFYALARTGKSGHVYPLGSGQGLPLKEYILKIRDAVNPQAEIGLGEVPYPKNQVMHLEADITDLIQDTGYKPSTDFSTGIQETVEWCRGKRALYEEN